MKLSLIVEQNPSGHYWGRIEGLGNFMPTGQGETIEALILNVRHCIEDYQEHEGKQDEFWVNVDVNALEMDLIARSIKRTSITVPDNISIGEVEKLVSQSMGKDFALSEEDFTQYIF